jgi:hypothetical protein
MRIGQKPVQSLVLITLLMVGALSIIATGGGGGGGGAVGQNNGPSPSTQSDWSIDLVAARAAVQADIRNAAAGDTNGSKYWVAWAGSNENPFVAEFDGTVWSAPVQVGKSLNTDNHSYPVMARDSLGRLHVFYGAHNSTLRHSVSPAADSISGTWIDQEIPQAAGATYPMPVAYAGTIYVFFRFTTGVEGGRPLYCVKSTDNGVTWAKETVAIDLARADNCNEVYVGQVKRIGSDVHFVWTAGGGPAHDAYHRDLYYARFSLQNEHFYDVSGDDLGTSIAGSASDSCLVYSSGQNTDKSVGYYSQVSVNGSGLPVLLWRWRSSLTDELRVTNWNGTTWSTNALDQQYQANQDIEAIEGSQAGFYAYVTPRHGPPGVWVLASHDNGNTWRAIELLQTKDEASCDVWIPLNNVGDKSRIKALWIQNLADPTQDSSTTTPTKNVYSAGIK